MRKNILIYVMLLFFFAILFLSDKLSINYTIDNHVIETNYCQELLDNYNELANDKDLEKKHPNLILTRIKYRDIYDYKNELIIYKGFKQGINVGMPVVINEGLVGIVIDTYFNTSRVQLITSKKLLLSVSINNNTGILKYDNELYIDDIDGNISIGDKVYTSQLGKIKDKIYIGSVKNIIKTSINNKIIVDSNINFNNLNYVFVVGDSYD